MYTLLRTDISPDAYYATALHEGGHASGHHTRLNRDMLGHPFGSVEYAREELRAEIEAQKAIFEAQHGEARGAVKREKRKVKSGGQPAAKGRGRSEQ